MVDGFRDCIEIKFQAARIGVPYAVSDGTDVGELR
jgi:hypothetical protein